MALQTTGVFLLVSLAWVFFRSPRVSVAWTVLKKIFSSSLGSPLNYGVVSRPMLFFSVFLITGLLIKERYMLVFPTGNTKLFYTGFIFLLMTCYLFGVFNNAQFIYFQF